MEKHTIPKVIFAAFLASQTNLVMADSFRCNNKLVREGDTTIEVKLKCGQPDDIEEIGGARVNNKLVKITRYTYYPKKGKLVKILEFQNGELVNIINGPRA